MEFTKTENNTWVLRGNLTFENISKVIDLFAPLVTSLSKEPFSKTIPLTAECNVGSVCP